MQNHTTLVALTVIGCIVLTSATVVKENGKAGNTGSPGETTCRQCHNDFALNAPGGGIQLSSTNMPGWMYEPGTTYHMKVTVGKQGATLFGVGLEALTTSNTNAGTLVITEASSQLKNATIGGVARRNLVHVENGGLANNQKAFIFDWQAPATDVGNVTFYFTGNAADGDGSNNGDFIYRGKRVVTPAPQMPVNPDGNEKLASQGRGALRAYPVPVRDVLYLDHTMLVDGDFTLTLVDMKGQVVEHLVSAPRTEGKHTEVLEGLDRHAAGSYVLRATVNGVQREQRILLEGSR
jgi:hypothetical protein